MVHFCKRALPGASDCGLQNQAAWVYISLASPALCVTLIKLVNLAKGKSSTHLVRSFEE